MNWKFAGEWFVKKYPPNKSVEIPKKIYEQLCEKDKKIILEDDKKSTVNIISFYFWLFFVIALVLLITRFV